MIRRMQPGDLAAGLRMTQAEQWSHRLEDWQFHYRLGRGWVVCDEHDTLLGTATWWSYGEHHGSVGLVLVDRAQQGKGIGRRLMEAIIDDAGSRALRLVATRAGLTLYQRCGFREVGLIEQRQGTLIAPSSIPCPDGMTMREVTADDLDALVSLDAAAFGAPRRELLGQLLSLGSGMIATLAGRPTGFALKRQAGRGALIGPLVASDDSLAIALVARVLSTSEGFTRIDIPADSGRLVQWLDTIGLMRVDTVTAMLRGNRPEAQAGARTFGLVSQAFG